MTGGRAEGTVTVLAGTGTENARRGDRCSAEGHRPAPRPILLATQDLLIEHGHPGTTIAAVANRARCGKSAIYRHWATKAELVVAAVGALQIAVPPPDTGALRSNLLAAATHFADGGERSGRVLASVLGEIGRDPELYDVARRALGAHPSPHS